MANQKKYPDPQNELNRDKPIAGIGQSSGDRRTTRGAAAEVKLQTGELPLSENERRMRERGGERAPRGVTGTVFRDTDLSNTMGTLTGEEDRDTVPGGWQGTDDATSTAPSDFFPDNQEAREEEDPDVATGRGYAGGIGEEDGGVVDIHGSPVEESRDWEHDSVEDDPFSR